MRLLVVILLLVSGAAKADFVTATRTIRAQSIIGAGDVILKPGDIPGAATDPAKVIGKEARVALYAGRPVLRSDLGPPAVIERNQIVQIIFERGGLSIIADGRSLSRAGVGERVRVMNMSSRNTVTGRVDASGRVFVSE